MKIAGLIMAILGWLIAVMSVKVPGAGGELAVALAGFLVALVGVVGLLNGAYLKNAIWKG